MIAGQKLGHTNAATMTAHASSVIPKRTGFNDGTRFITMMSWISLVWGQFFLVAEYCFCETLVINAIPIIQAEAKHVKKNFRYHTSTHRGQPWSFIFNLWNCFDDTPKSLDLNPIENL